MDAQGRAVHGVTSVHDLPMEQNATPSTPATNAPVGQNASVDTTVTSQPLQQNVSISTSTTSPLAAEDPGQELEWERAARSAVFVVPSQVLYGELKRRRDQWRDEISYSMSPTESLLAGVAAGVLAKTATAPLELIKTLFQLQSSPIAAGSTKGYHSMSHALITIAREEGIKAWWKGNNVGCLRLGPYSGVKFMVYDSVKANFFNNRLNTFQQLYVGSFAGIVATVSTYPLDVVKTRMSVQKYGAIYKGTWDALTTISRQEGLRGMFKGCFATLVGVIPFEGVQFAVYETLKEYCLCHRWPSWRWADEKTESDALDILIIGSIAGASGQTVSYPFDLVRKRIQVQAKNFEGFQAEHYENTIDCFIKIYKNEGGVRGWFKGTVPNLIRVIPYGAIIFFTYEGMKSFFAWYDLWRMDSQWHQYLKLYSDQADHIDRMILEESLEAIASESGGG